MKFTIDKKLGKDKFQKQKFLSDYHKWLENQRQKDKKKLPDKQVVLANAYLSKYLCPFCKEKVELVEDDQVQQKVCKKHGILAVRRKEWRIWSPYKNKEERK